MDDQTLAIAIESFWQRRQEGVYFPEEWFGKLAIADGYQVQLGLLNRLKEAGARQVGWKVGLTSVAMQQQFAVHEPLFGYLLDEGVTESPAQLEFAPLIAPGVENEICMTMGRDLVGLEVTVDEAREAIAGVRPAMELVETRGPFSEQLPIAVAENIQQKGVILGSQLSPLSPDLNLPAVKVAVHFNGQLAAEATGAAVLGDPLRAVAWLAGKLTQHGRRLEAGQIVMTGSLTRQFAVATGDHVVAQWEPFGSVIASFV